MKNTFFGIVAVIGLSGCAGINYAIENYSDVDVKQFSYQETTFRIFDKPEENRLMITPNLGDTIGGSAVQGLTLGLSGPMGGPEGSFQAVTQAYLDQQGNGCKVTNGALVVQPQWEFFYEC